MPPFSKKRKWYAKELIERIKDILSTEGLRAPKDIDVARELKLHPNTLAQAKFQNRIPYLNIMDFLQRRQISINLFFYGQSLEEVAKASERYKILKLYTANASAGFGGMNERVFCRDLIVDDFLIEKMEIKESNEAIFVVGDSMQELITDGSIALLDRKDTAIKNGKIYAINSLDGLFIKQCFLKDGVLELHSLNTLYSPLKYNLNEVLILGRV